MADVAVVALSHLGIIGAATALGEQPIKGLLDPGAGARLALCEAITNLCFARVTDLRVGNKGGIEGPVGWLWGQWGQWGQWGGCGVNGGSRVGVGSMGAVGWVWGQWGGCGVNGVGMGSVGWLWGQWGQWGGCGV